MTDAQPDHEYNAERTGGIGHERLSTFLRSCRARVPRECASLGDFRRLPSRVGKPVTQHEVAEACGISRQWYVLMENDRSVRVSGKVLHRIAETLMMTSAERVTLFRLAVPELRSVSVTEKTKRAVDAIAQFCPLMRELWSATTETAALTIARAFARKVFQSDAVMTSATIDDGCLESPITGVEHERFSVFKNVLEEYCGAFARQYPSAHGVTALPSEVLTRPELDVRLPEHAAKLRRALDDARCPNLSIAMVRLESRRGLAVTLALLNYQLHTFTAHERTQLRTIAGIVSLALSATPVCM